MPTLARWYIKTALLYLSAALLLGVGIAAAPLVPGLWTSAGLWPTYVHLFTMGWLTQLIFGVAYWLFPRVSRERPYGRKRMAWWAYGLLNGGLLLRAFAEPAAWAGRSWMLAGSAALQWIATILFVLYLWQRVRTK